jgi:anion-transporting  ArsA/GET3 family ATPase
VIVTGKGGTGKTSVVAALALAAARAGRRVLVAETGLAEAVPPLIAPGSAPVGYAGRELRPGLTALRIEPYEALAEYVGLQFGMRAMTDLVFRNAAFHQLMDASPGWRELITLGKVWHLRQQQGPDGRPLYDLVIVDAPATGHGITFLDVPRVVVSAIRAGPLRRHASWVEEMVRNPDETLLLPVALAEELPARETAELVSRLREDVGVTVDRVVVNAVARSPLPPEVPDLAERLERLPDDLDCGGLPRPPVLAACVRHATARAELNAHYRDQIAADTGLPIVELPYLDGGVSGPQDLERLADALAAEPEDRNHAADPPQGGPPVPPQGGPPVPPASGPSAPSGDAS